MKSAGLQKKMWNENVIYHLELVLVKEGVIPRKVVHTEGKKLFIPRNQHIVTL